MNEAIHQGSVELTVKDGIGTIEFFHPLSNSLPGKILTKLADTITDAGNNNDISVIILKSEGDRAFCAGASFDELMAVSNLEEGTIFFSGFANVINAMRSCQKVIIGRVQGKTVGGGVGLAAACDYVFASVEASVRLSELTIGIAPLVIGPAVERKIGKAAISELSLSPTEWKNAYWAKEKGLFARVYDSISELDKEVEFFAQKLSKYNPQGLKEWKKVLWEGIGHWDTLLVERAAITGALVLSEFTKNALSKFKK